MPFFLSVLKSSCVPTNFPKCSQQCRSAGQGNNVSLPNVQRSYAEVALSIWTKDSLCLCGIGNCSFNCENVQLCVWGSWLCRWQFSYVPNSLHGLFCSTACYAVRFLSVSSTILFPYVFLHLAAITNQDIVKQINPEFSFKNAVKEAFTIEGVRPFIFLGLADSETRTLH